MKLWEAIFAMQCEGKKVRKTFWDLNSFIYLDTNGSSQIKDESDNVYVIQGHRVDDEWEIYETIYPTINDMNKEILKIKSGLEETEKAVSLLIDECHQLKSEITQLKSKSYVREISARIGDRLE